MQNTTSSLQLSGLTSRKEKNGSTVITAKFFVATYAEALGIGTPSFISGLGRTAISCEQEEHGQGYVVTATYQGATGDDGTSSSYDEATALPIYEWSPSFEQVDILTHPKIKTLLEKYEGVVDKTNGTIQWPEELSNPAGSNTSSLSGNKSQTPVTSNPMLGVREYLSLGGIWSKRSIKKTIPATLFSDVGKIIDNPPDPTGGSFPSPGNRFWLTMPPSVMSRGTDWEITERWMLSGVDSQRAKDAAKDIYESLTLSNP
jgi:hypothetical protein